MIGHEAPSTDFDIGGPARAAEEIGNEGMIIGTEDVCRRPPAVAALGDMVRDMGNDHPGRTGHARTVAARGTRVN